ncbi:inorganic phosphate transporter Pho88 [Zychaea mexicana]|uniref:inorganic phosphate transporter Pho88 n=1 Tax=Zychaea mexicana TaxID=64656 RepID=UPI0022FE531C|nr:inorganic phosphate transporter Pho88 [Zychaea mexicana]KAI9492288.1 inorganic phosphate transporter Pho88 [Zychaea mexicana]
MLSLSRVVNHPLFNFAFFMGIRQVTKRLPLEEPSYLWSLRILYLTCQFIAIGMNYWLIWQVNKKNDTTSLRYVEPAQQQWDGTQSEEKLVSTTNKDYDVAEIKKVMKQSFTGIAMIGFLHLQFKFVQPLIIQSIMVFKTFFTSKEARIHIWGESTSSGPLRRPFRADSPFGFMPQGKQPKTDKASIKRAEKAMKAE